MFIGHLWFLANLLLGLIELQLLSIWFGGTIVGRGLGFSLHGVSG